MDFSVEVICFGGGENNEKNVRKASIGCRRCKEGSCIWLCGYGYLVKI